MCYTIGLYCFFLKFLFKKKNYTNIAEYFSRSLKGSVRPFVQIIDNIIFFLNGPILVLIPDTAYIILC